MKTIYVINPNSSQNVTDGIDRAIEPLRIPGGPPIDCLTLADGPPGIQTQQHIDDLTPSLRRLAQSLEADAAAYVIACFSDPGLFSLREISNKPVFGIAECGILTALTMGHRFGVISILATSIPRHLRYFAAMGVDDRLAGDLAIDMGVQELSNTSKTLDRMIQVGRRLRTDHGADVLVLGCAGMAGLRAELEKAVGVPVVEPTQAATAMALGRVRLQW